MLLSFILAAMAVVSAAPAAANNSSVFEALDSTKMVVRGLNCEGPFKNTRVGVCHGFDFKDCVDFNFIACVCYPLSPDRWSGAQGLSSVGFGGSYTRCQLYEDYQCSSLKQYYVSKDETNLF
jgi:hypothetical protein